MICCQKNHWVCDALYIIEAWIWIGRSQQTWEKDVTRFLCSLTKTDGTNVSEQMCLKQKLVSGRRSKAESSVSTVSCPSWYYCRCRAWGWRGAWEPLTSFVLCHCMSSGCPSRMLHRRSEEQLCISVWRRASRTQLLWCPWKTNNKTGNLCSTGIQIVHLLVWAFVRSCWCLLLYLLTVFTFR